jgi:hypothetical protein
MKIFDWRKRKRDIYELKVRAGIIKPSAWPNVKSALKSGCIHFYILSVVPCVTWIFTIAFRNGTPAFIAGIVLGISCLFLFWQPDFVKRYSQYNHTIRRLFRSMSLRQNIISHSEEEAANNHAQREKIAKLAVFWIFGFGYFVVAAIIIGIMGQLY